MFATATGTLSDPAAAAAVDAALADVAQQPHVDAVGTLRRAPDGRVAYADVQYDVALGPDPDRRVRPARSARAAEVNARTPVRMELGGDLPSEAVRPEFGGQEFVGLLVAAIVLLFAFGSVIAMGLPIGTALVGLARSVGLITVIASFVDVSSVSPTIATMIGLGVGIDYALFIVTRHREHLQLGLTVEEPSAARSRRPASAVMFAGTTVVIAICGLAIAGIPLVTVMGLTAGLMVAVMVVVAVTLLPALLGFAGHKIDSVRLPLMRRAEAAAATRPDARVDVAPLGPPRAAHPWRYLVAGVVVLLAARWRRCSACASARPTRLDAAIDHDPPRLRPARRRASARASTARCCSSAELPGASVASLDALAARGGGRSRRRRASRPCRPTPTAPRPCSASSRIVAAGRGHHDSSSTGCATT